MGLKSAIFVKSNLTTDWLICRLFSAIMSGTQEQKPVKVAEAISKLIATKAGERPFRTTVDAIGMSTPIREYNELSTQFTQKLFNDYGILELTKLKK